MKKLIPSLTIFLATSALVLACGDKNKPRFGKNTGGNGNDVTAQKTDDTKLLESAAEAVFSVSLARYSLRRSPFPKTACTPEGIEQNDCIQAKPIGTLDIAKAKKFNVEYNCPGQVLGTQVFEMTENEEKEKMITVTSEALTIYVNKKPIQRKQELTLAVGKDKCLWTQTVIRDKITYYAKGGEFTYNDAALKKAAVKELLVGTINRDEDGNELFEHKVNVEDELETKPQSATPQRPAPTNKPVVRTPPVKPTTPEQRIVKNLKFDVVELNWSTNCSHPPTGFLKYKYLKVDKPEEGSIQVVKDKVVHPSSTVKPLSWPVKCGTNAGEVPVSIDMSAQPK
jgi:hypothetical protein